MTEEEIIKGCIQQDRKHQNALYKMYFPLMSSIALRYAADKDEALQGLNFGFLKVLQNMEKYNSEYALATWIRRVLVNHFIDEFRKKKKNLSTVYLSNYEYDDNLVSYNIAQEEFDAEDLRNMLDSLPEVTGKVFNLFAIDGYKHKEIAEQLGISEGTSKWHVSEARKRLKQAIKTQEEEGQKKSKMKGVASR